MGPRLPLRCLSASSLAVAVAIALAACDARSCVDGPSGERASRTAQPRSPGSCDEVVLGLDPWRDDGTTRALEERGHVLGCTHFMSASAEVLRRHPAARQDLGGLRAGAELFQLRYVTEGRPAVAAPATALLYVPTGIEGTIPVALVEHGTTGMGPGCAPSRTHEAVDALAVPFVARGYAVVAPDYAGLGIDTGMNSYLVGAREAASSLDALRAARRFRDRRFDGARLGDEVVIVGFSQGGHAALFTHGAFDPSRDGRLLGSVSFAPALGDMRAWRPFFAEPDRATDGMTLYATMMLYAQALEHGDPAVSSWLSPEAQGSLPRLFHDLCLGALGGTFRDRFPRQGDVYAPRFQAAASRCAFDADCTDFDPWRTRLLAEEPGAFRSTAPALLASGDADGVVPGATVACIRERLVSNGTGARACSYVGANHGDVPARALGDALRWLDARRRGEDLDVCEVPLEARCSAAAGTAR
jgi:dienelactone hydrolase